MLQFTLLGNAEIRQNGRIVSLPYRKAEALLYYMLMQRKAYRSELVELIWPDTEPSAALKNLRHAVYTIRKSLQCDFFLTAQRAVLELNPDVPFHCDALLFQENGSPEEYRGEFLKNFTVPQAVPYEEWLTETRAQLHTLYLRHLLEAERLSFTQGDLEKAEQYGRTYLDEDPFDESAASILMQVCAAQKQFRRAVKVYLDLRQNLNRELGIPPMKETTSLYYRIMNQWNSSTVQPEETPDSLLVGKSPALRKLLNVCRNRGRLSCFLLEGEPGVGKTRLVDHLLEKYDFADRITCRSFCFQTESNVPLSPWNEIMLTLSQEIRERGLDVDSISLSLASGLFPCLLSAWGWKAGSMDLNSNLPLREPYKTARDSTLSILSGVARSVPLLLIFEDLHWMDKSSVRLLGLLMRQLRNRDIILLLTSREVRPDYVEQLIRDATRDSIMERCELTRFTLEETAQFVSAYLGREQPEDLIEQMHQNRRQRPAAPAADLLHSGVRRPRESAPGHGEHHPLPDQ